MTDETINALVATRNRLTDRRDEQVDWDAVDMIDDALTLVPPGQDNRVDLLLGRSCAQLPDYYATAAALEAEAQRAEYAQYSAMSDGQPDGIIEHDDHDAGMWM